MASLLETFGDMPDPRVERGKLHKLIDILVISLCATICGAEGWEDFAEYGAAREEWFAGFLELPNGIPSPDTFRRVFARLDAVEFEARFLRWVSGLGKLTRGQVAVDGKTLRGSRDADRSAIHMVSAWAVEAGLVLGQVKTDEKSNEITAIPDLLAALDLHGCIVTIDAMGCQRAIAEMVDEQGGDYVLAVKDNQKTLAEEIETYFEAPPIPLEIHTTVDGDHGRIETRRYAQTGDIEWLDPEHLWKNLTSIGMVESTREVNGKISVERRYFISSLEVDVKQFARLVRGHWGIENSLHWVLDVAFREDESRIRRDNGPQNLAILRHISLNLLKQATSSKRGIKARRKLAAWNPDYLLEVIAGI